MTHIYGTLCGRRTVVPVGATTLWSGVQLAKDLFIPMACPYGASRSLSLDTPHLLVLLFSSDQPDAETYIPVNTQHSQETKSMPPAGFEPAFPTNERLQTHALDRAAIGTGS